MNEQFTTEQLVQARGAETPETLLALAQEHGVTLTPEEAQARFDQLHQTGEVSDEELDNVAGGGCGEERPEPKYKVGGQAFCRKSEGPLWFYCANCYRYQQIPALRAIIEKQIWKDGEWHYLLQCDSHRGVQLGRADTPGAVYHPEHVISRGPTA